MGSSVLSVCSSEIVRSVISDSQGKSWMLEASLRLAWKLSTYEA